MVSDPATRLKLQIVAESMPVPWGLLYVGDASSGARLDWDNFMGMRHLIEQIPLQNTLTVSDPGIPSDKPQLMVSLNVNSGIDTQMHSDFVAQQQAFWADAKASRKRVRVTARTTSAEVVKALADGATEDQISILLLPRGIERTNRPWRTGYVLPRPNRREYYTRRPQSRRPNYDAAPWQPSGVRQRLRVS